MIEIKNLSKNFAKLQVLRQINLTCNRGECIALIGPNGCGKTTLIKNILGMVIPSEGQVIFNGKDIANNFEYRRHIGYMPQIGRYPDNMTIGQVIEMMINIRKPSGDLDKELITLFNLDELYNKRMHTLSGGTTQKVSASLALLFNPEVLILDEPTAGLDPLASEIMKEKILAEKRKGKLIIITSHLLSELDDLVSEVIFMQEGIVKFHRSIQQLISITGEEKLSKAIAGILRTGNHE